MKIYSQAGTKQQQEHRAREQEPGKEASLRINKYQACPQEHVRMCVYA